MRESAGVRAMVFLAACGTLTLACSASAEWVVAGDGDETIAEAYEEAREAVARSGARFDLRYVGFNVEDPAAEAFFNDISRSVPNVGFSAVSDAGQLGEALADAGLGRSWGSGVIQIHSPSPGDAVDASAHVIGKAPPGELVVVYLLLFHPDTGEELARVHGMRARVSAETGEFDFRIAFPTPINQRELKVRYEIHAHTVQQDGSESAATVVSVVRR